MLDLFVMIGVSFGIPTGLALLLSRRWKEPKAYGWCLAAMGAVAVNLVVVGMAPDLIKAPAFMKGLEWNWIGKVATIIATLIIFALLPKALRAETGILTIPRTDRWDQVIWVCLGLLIFFWGAAFMTRDGTAATSEYYVFQAFMPSLDEEFAYRGTILALLVAALGKPHKFLGIQTGWAALPIITVFGMMHGFQVIFGGEPIDYPALALTLLITGTAGAGLYWIKEKTNSVWLCVLMHSLMNLGSGFFNGFTT